jgi:heat shock protein HslJ
MLQKKWLFITLFLTFVYAKSIDIDDFEDTFQGAWHLHVMDGMEVRKARAILDFTIESNTTDDNTTYSIILSGFDSCNRITGTVQEIDNNLTIPIIMSTKMGCRGKVHRWVSKRLQETLKEHFSIKESEKYDPEGIRIKSVSHTLFFKKMER